ncbi:HNH endonuclease [Paenibacillus sp. y28]|uniref:HNH endonuclease n=1 Tax=Paenibacillus sp. y28 TaxID=3129110 RepID=UPI003FA6C7B3
MRGEQLGICELCGRDSVTTTEHHLVPREKGGAQAPTARLCVACHKQIHALFTNDQLVAGLYTLELLKANPAVARYLKWIRKQPPSVVPRLRKSREVRGWT